MELRCEHKMHGVLVGDLLEVKCGSSLCGSGPGIVVIHQFDPLTGDLVNTKRYRDTPTVNGKEQGNGQQSAVRSA